MTLGTFAPRVELLSRDGTVSLADLTPYVTDLECSREFDRITTGTVELAKPDGCCELFKHIDPWATCIRVSRNDAVVHEGPVIRDIERERERVVVWADPLAWLERRVVSPTLDYTGTPTDATAIVNDLVVNGFTPDDPNVLPFVQVVSGALDSENKYDAATAPIVWQQITSLTSTLVDVYCVGRRIVITPERHSWGNVGTLALEHFGTARDGQEVEYQRRGETFASKVIVKGEGVSGQAGGVDPRYGLIVDVVDDQTIKTAAAAQNAAVARLESRSRRVPSWVVAPSGVQLTCDAPIDFNKLVPGSTVKVDTRQLACEQTLQEMRLIGLKYGWTQDAGETVRVALSNSGETGA